MKNKRHIILLSLLLVSTLFLAACSSTGQSNASGTNWEEYKNIYKTVVQNTGEDESTEKYLEIAERSVELLQILENNTNAFVVDAYNYQSIDDEGTLLYTMNSMDYPQEIDPYGQCIRVSKNYFQHNPIETVDGNDLVEQIVYDDLTLNVLVPQKYQAMESQIIAAYREAFYFEKVQATNDYNEMAGIDTVLDISEENLVINIIYVKDGQRYFTFRPDCAVSTDNWIEDPLVKIYTSNIHCNYAHSIVSQWLYFYSEKNTAEEAYLDIEQYVKQCGAENSVQYVVSLNDE